MEDSGIVIIDKPSGWSSFRVVQFAKRTLGVKRAGHTGTLDPLATGVLPVCLNEATKAIPFLLEDEKEYEGALVLGAATDTFDCEGRIVSESDVPEITLAEAQSIFGDFTGDMKQIPPIFAALKSNGKPLYYWARKGIPVEKEARHIRIKELKIEKFDPPEIAFRVVCSRGTYIRSLVNDIGRRIGCGAYLNRLRRLRSGPFTIGEAVLPGDLKESDVRPICSVLGHIPSVKVEGGLSRNVEHGMEISVDKLSILPGSSEKETPLIKILTKQGSLLAIYSWKDNGQNLKPVRVFKARSDIVAEP
ncbi:MAG: tRNA pseudouridine(55) synthase TruB [Pseudomonadota bacterium]